jgi:uncharacterized protein (TIGR00725 family)
LTEARFRQVAVIGASQCGEELAATAEAVGRGLAEAGATVISGGLGGVMEAASRGATEAGGTAIGILPGSSTEAANPQLSHAIATGIGEARNLAVVSSGRAVIAIGGSWGTLSEIGFARKLGRFVVSIDSWELARAGEELGIATAASAEEAVSAALAALASGSS